MYIATQEITTNERTYQVGEEVPNPTARMIDVGAVRRQPQAAKVAQAPVLEKVKEQSKDQVKSKKQEKIEKVEKTEKVDLQDEILTEDSASIEVKTEVE